MDECEKEGKYLVKGTITTKMFENEFPSGSIRIEDYEDVGEYKNGKWYVFGMECFKFHKTGWGYQTISVNKWKEL